MLQDPAPHQCNAHRWKLSAMPGRVDTYHEKSDIFSMLRALCVSGGLDALREHVLAHVLDNACTRLKVLGISCNLHTLLASGTT